MASELSESEILACYEREGAVWFFNYNGDPKAPHAKLTSGLCSDGYVNSAPVLSLPDVTQLLAHQLKIRLGNQRINKVDWVVGSAYAAITFSYELAKELNARHGFVEKDPSNPKHMVWNRFVIPSGAVVLQCEELITTFGTTLEVRRAIQDDNPNPVNFLPCVATAIYRPAKLDDTLPISVIALVGREVKSWIPEDCPLCKNGSERLRPKQNWAKLTGKA